MLVLGRGFLLRFEAGAQFPDEGAEFARDADLDFVVMELPFAQGVEAVTEAYLSFPGKVLDPGVNAFLAC